MELTSAIGRAVQNVLKWNWEGVDDSHTEPEGNRSVAKLENGSGTKLENGSDTKLENGLDIKMENGSGTKLENGLRTKLENESVFDSLLKDE
jgi:hypothetical protein